jgi:hypothetical protein
VAAPEPEDKIELIIERVQKSLNTSSAWRNNGLGANASQSTEG